MTLDRIVEQEEWELMSLCLLLGMFRSSLAIPEDALTEAAGSPGRRTG